MELFKEIVILAAYIVMAAGALVAVVSYIRQGYAKRKAVATLLVYQIDCIEDALQSFKQLLAQENLKNDAIIRIRPFSCTAWNENKHLLLGELKEADRRALDSYFNSASFIQDAREKLIVALSSNWDARAIALAFGLSGFVSTDTTELSEDERRKIDCFYRKYAVIDNSFTPSIPLTILIEHVTTWKPLSGTTTYDNLRKISYVKD